MHFFENDYYRMVQYAHPFSVDRFTNIIDLKGYVGSQVLNEMDRGALLSRYSRSTKSMIELIYEEFMENPNRGTEFYNRVLNEYGDDSIAELSSKQIGIEGLSILAATELTDRRIGISFLEKSTRYLPFSADNFYIPGEFYTYGVVDEYKELCALSFKTFTYINEELKQLLAEQYPLEKCTFQKGDKMVAYHLLSTEEKEMAAKSYHRAIRDRAYDNASYCWLTSLTTNIGFNANCRSLEYLLHNLKASRLNENFNLGENMLSLLNHSIAPFLKRVDQEVITDQSQSGYLISNSENFNTYNPDGSDSMISVYKANIVNLLKPYDTFQEDLEHIDGGTAKLSPEQRLRAEQQKNHKKTNMNILNQILHNNDTIARIKTDVPYVNQDNFRPSIFLADHRDEKRCINLLCAAILSQYNENLLDYDEYNFNNLDANLRIKPLEPNSIQNGILYDLVNESKTIDEIANLYDDIHLNRITENGLRLNEFITYFEESSTTFDTTLYQDYDSDKLVITKDQQFLINSYVKNRRNRRQTLGRAFETVDYLFDITSSFRVFRDLKRHRINTLIKPPVLTTRNSFDNYIFPDLILKNENLFNAYKLLIEKSYALYEKLIKGTNDYITAQYVLPLAVKFNYSIKINARALDYLLSLRTIPQGHEEYREICQLIYSTVKIVHPNIAKLFKFVDLNKYNLGRINYEFKKEQKLSA